MKKVILFFAAILIALSTFAQTKTMYVDGSCERAVPNYLDSVVVTDNCQLQSVTQLPVAGTILNGANQSTQVVILAEDVFGNQAALNFELILLDSIPPVIQWIGTPFASLDTKFMTNPGGKESIENYLVISSTEATEPKDRKLSIEIF